MSQNVCCPHCGIEVQCDPKLGGQVVSCPGCNGQFQMPYPQASFAQDSPPNPFPVRDVYIHSPPKNSGIAAVLSFLCPGLGQMYNGAVGKGILLLILLMTVFTIVTHFMPLIGILLLLILWIWGIYDAYNTAERLNLKARQSRR